MHVCPARYFTLCDNSRAVDHCSWPCTMTMNKDEAERAYLIAKKHEQENAFEKACKFYQKSLQLHHSEEAAAAVIRVRCLSLAASQHGAETRLHWLTFTSFSPQVQEKIRLSSTTRESDDRTTHTEYTRETSFTQESVSSAAQFTPEQVRDSFRLSMFLCPSSHRPSERAREQNPRE